MNKQTCRTNWLIQKFFIYRLPLICSLWWHSFRFLTSLNLFELHKAVLHKFALLKIKIMPLKIDYVSWWSNKEANKHIELIKESLEVLNPIIPITKAYRHNEKNGVSIQ